MRAIKAVLAATSLLLLLPAASQSPAERIARAKDIPVEEWTAMAMGRTLTYRINGELWAFEHYYPGTDRVTLQLYDGSCMEGWWAYTAPTYCFFWEGQDKSCFRHARLGSEIIIIENHDGVDTPMTQSMTAVTDMPLTCGPAVMS
jgi:hypothetical protein